MSDQIQVNKYDNSIIYKIVCNDPTIKDVYVGSTININKRIILHKSECTNPNTTGYNSPVYKFIRSNGGWENWRLIIIELFECDNNNDLRLREKYFKNRLNAKLNNNEPHTTQEEKIISKRKYDIVYYKSYYESRKEHYKAYYQAKKEKKAKENNI